MRYSVFFTLMLPDYTSEIIAQCVRAGFRVGSNMAEGEPVTTIANNDSDKSLTRTSVIMALDLEGDYNDDEISEVIRNILKKSKAKYYSVVIIGKFASLITGNIFFRKKDKQKTNNVIKFIPKLKEPSKLENTDIE